MAFVRKKTSRGSTNYVLVENRREEGKVRQKVICHLGTEPECAALGGALALAEKKLAASREQVSQLKDARAEAKRQWRWKAKDEVKKLEGRLEGKGLVWFDPEDQERLISFAREQLPVLKRLIAQADPTDPDWQSAYTIRQVWRALEAIGRAERLIEAAQRKQDALRQRVAIIRKHL